MRITFESQALGPLTITPSSDKVREYVEALIILGFEPKVEMEN